MALNQALAFSGLQGSENLSSHGVSGIATIGSGLTQTQLSSATQAVTFAVELDGASTEVEIDLTTLLPTITGGTAVAQVETFTASDSISGGFGNLSVVVTAAKVTGSPLTILVDVLAADPAADWGTAVRNAILATAAITAHYNVTGAAETTILTEITPAGNDPTLSIVVSAGTTTAPSLPITSANTTAGHLAAKCYRLTGVTYTGDNFEGADAPTPVTYHGLEIATSGTGSLTLVCGELADALGANDVLHKHSTSGLANSFGPGGNTLTLTGNTGGSITASVTLAYATT